MTRLEIAVRLAVAATPSAYPAALDADSFERLNGELSNPSRRPDGSIAPLLFSMWCWRCAGDLIGLAVEADKREGGT